MLNKKALAATAAADKLYVEDVFSTYLFTGTGSSQTITNNIDLSTEGGLVWTKRRDASSSHGLYDTLRGTTKRLRTNTTDAEDTLANSVTAFNTDGFSIGSQFANAETYASWTFRKAEKFFDVVTYTGDGTTNRNITHNLGSTPGCVIVKRTDSTGAWPTWHRSLAGTNYNMYLNTTAASGAETDFSSNGSSSFTSTTFTVNNAGSTNNSGATYVAYLFAHDAGGFGDSGSESVIKCGSFTGTGSLTSVNLGWEPQWVLFKRSSGATDNWRLLDNMRSWAHAEQRFLYPNTSNFEGSSSSWGTPTATGMDILGSSGDPYIYIAIRRGPMKTPEAGTEVFAAQISDQTGSSTSPEFTSGFPVDSYFLGQMSGTDKWYWLDRLRGDYPLNSASTAAEGSFFSAGFDFNNGVYDSSIVTSYYATMFRRAPGFFDVVCYSGTSANRTITHNLGAVPELMIVKTRSVGDWAVYHSSLGNNTAVELNKSGGSFTVSTYWNNTTPTSSVFSVGTSAAVNASGDNYVAYLFASVTGVSKVGSYTGNGSSQTINCGFTGGARFVLIKRTDSTGDWVVFDSARGIVSGNDPYLRLNSTAAEVTDKDAVDTDSTGFVVNETTGPNINTNGASYIYLAIA